MKGRKRHFLVDHQGWVCGVLVHAGNVSEKAGDVRLLVRLLARLHGGPQLDRLERI